MTMIRINLIAEKKASTPKAAKKVASGGGGQGSELQENIILIVMVLLAGLTFYFLNKSVKDELAQARQTGKRLDKEYNKLKKWEEKQLDYEVKKELLNEKIKKISSLKDTRQGPSKVMEDIANVLPDSVWLESVTQGYDKKLVAGGRHGGTFKPTGRNLSDPSLIRVTGKAKTTEAITNFAERIIKMDKRYTNVELSNLDREGKGGRKADEGPKEYTFELFFTIMKERPPAGGGEGQP